MPKVVEQLRKNQELKQNVRKCGQTGHTARNKACPQFNSHSSSSSQNQSSNQNLQNEVESDEGESDDENEEIDAIGNNVDGDNDDDDDIDDDLQSAADWIPLDIHIFQPQTSRSSQRKSTSPNNNVPKNPTNADFLPPFKGYRGRGEFSGVNKRVVEENNCGRSVLKFFMLFISEAILSAFVIATNTYGRMYQ